MPGRHRGERIRRGDLTAIIKAQEVAISQLGQHLGHLERRSVPGQAGHAGRSPGVRERSQHGLVHGSQATVGGRDAATDAKRVLAARSDSERHLTQLTGDLQREDEHLAEAEVAIARLTEESSTIDRVDASKPMSFSTMNGEIDVTLPATTKGNFRMKTDNGEIFSDFEVKLDRAAPITTSESGKTTDGKFRVRFDRTIRGADHRG